MRNPMNCNTCRHHEINDDPELHCYMFKNAPTEVCMQHTANKPIGGTRAMLNIIHLLKEVK